jgi:hypothetical protein
MLCHCSPECPCSCLKASGVVHFTYRPSSTPGALIVALINSHPQAPTSNHTRQSALIHSRARGRHLAAHGQSHRHSRSATLLCHCAQIAPVRVRGTNCPCRQRRFSPACLGGRNRGSVLRGLPRSAAVARARERCPASPSISTLSKKLAKAVADANTSLCCTGFVVFQRACKERASCTRCAQPSAVAKDCPGAAAAPTTTHGLSVAHGRGDRSGRGTSLRECCGVSGMRGARPASMQSGKSRSNTRAATSS